MKRLTRLYLIRRSDTPSYGVSIEELKNNRPYYVLLEWLIEPVSASELELWDIKKDKNLHYYEGKLVKPWRQALEHHLLPDILFKEVNNIELHKAVRTLEQAYPQQLPVFLQRFRALEERLLLMLEVKYSVDLLITPKVWSEDSSQSPHYKDHTEALEPILEEIKKEWLSYWRETDDKLHLQPKLNAIAKVLFSADEKGKRLLPESFVHAKKELKRVIGQAELRVEAVREALIPLAWFAESIHSEADLLRVLRIVQTYLCAFDSESNAANGVWVREPLSDCGIWRDKLEQINKTAADIHRKFADLNRYSSLIKNNTSLETVEYLSDFITYESSDVSLLSFIRNNPCPDSLKLRSLELLLALEEFPWKTAFRDCLPDLSFFLGLWAREGFPNPNLRSLFGSRLEPSNVFDIVQTGLQEHQAWPWLIFFDPQEVEERLRKREIDVTKGWFPYIKQILAELKDNRLPHPPDFKAFYTLYWGYLFSSDTRRVEEQGLSFADEAKLDVQGIHYYLMQGGDLLKLEQWLQTELFQKQVRLFASEAFYKHKPYLLDIAADLLQEDGKKAFVREWLVSDAEESVKSSAIQVMGYRFIGKDMEPDRLKEAVNQSPHEYEMEGEQPFAAGSDYIYHLVRPGLKHTVSEVMVAKAVIRTELTNEEVIDQMFDDLSKF